MRLPTYRRLRRLGGVIGDMMLCIFVCEIVGMRSQPKGGRLRAKEVGMPCLLRMEKTKVLVSEGGRRKDQ